MTYSIDFRQHVLKVKAEEGLSFAVTSKRFKIGKNTLFLWSKEITPQPKRNKPATKVNMEALKEDIKRYPDAYHYERASRLQVSKTGIYWAMKRLGVSYKKNSGSSENRRRIALIV
jgi:transposase